MSGLLYIVCFVIQCMSVLLEFAALLMHRFLFIFEVKTVMINIHRYSITSLLSRTVLFKMMTKFDPGLHQDLD